MEKDLKQLQKKEALKRLKILQDKFELMETVTKEFKQDNTLYYSEYVNKSCPAILYWVSNKKEYENAVKEFEEKHNTLVYHCILNRTTFGTILTLLYVTEEQEEWKEDKEQLQEGLPLSYVVNLSDNECSEFGGIQIGGAMGGIVRLA